MSRTRLLKITLFVALALIVATTAALAATRNFRTHLSGALEIPGPIDTKAQGQAIFQLSKDGKSMSYKLIVANIENVTMAHIHLIEQPNGTGRVVVWLYPLARSPQEIPGRFQGVLGEGVITQADLVGPLGGQPLSALLDAIHTGTSLAFSGIRQSSPQFWQLRDVDRTGFGRKNGTVAPAIHLASRTLFC
jgi:hypothetical protein